MYTFVRSTTRSLQSSIDRFTAFKDAKCYKY